MQVSVLTEMIDMEYLCISDITYANAFSEYIFWTTIFARKLF